MVVVITSAGNVTKRVASFDQPVDQGLAGWARQYLNEQLVGVQLGTQLLRRRLDDPSLSATERDFIERLRPAFTELVALDEALRAHGLTGRHVLLDDAKHDLALTLGQLELHVCRHFTPAARPSRPRRGTVREASG